MRILIQHDAQRLGPYTRDEARAALAAGQVRATDLAWQEGTPSWVPLASLLAGPAAAAAAPAFATPKQTSGAAIASLVLGIMSIVTCLSFITGIPAIICGHLSRSRIKKSGGQLGGEGLALGGLITGYVGTLLLLPILAAIAIPAFVGARERALNVAGANNARQVILACKSYAMDQQATGQPGDFPPDLETLFARGYLPKEHRDTTLKVPGDPSPIGYEYFGAEESDPETHVVFVSKKEVQSGKRIVARKSGEVEVARYDAPQR